MAPFANNTMQSAFLQQPNTVYVNLANYPDHTHWPSRQWNSCIGWASTINISNEADVPYSYSVWLQTARLRIQIRILPHSFKQAIWSHKFLEIANFILAHSSTIYTFEFPQTLDSLPQACTQGKEAMNTIWMVPNNGHLHCALCRDTFYIPSYQTCAVSTKNCRIYTLIYIRKPFKIHH